MDDREIFLEEFQVLENTSTLNWQLYLTVTIDYRNAYGDHVDIHND